MPTDTQHPFGEFLVFVDESGDHSLTKIDPIYSVFVLAFAIIRKADYTQRVCPKLQEFKFRYWGHDAVVLHEHEIRKPKDDFTFLHRQSVRTQFLNELNHLMDALPAAVVAVIIDKNAFASHHAEEHPGGAYDYAMQTGLNAVFRHLASLGQADHTTPIIVECRGRKEDTELELAFRRFCATGNEQGRLLPLELVMVPKTANSAGLQLADLIARPIGLHHLRPHQPNRAFDLIRPKLCRASNGKVEGTGLIRVT